mgnify:FL=1
MFLDRVEEIHATIVHTDSSGEGRFPVCDRKEWSEKVVERVTADENNEFASTYSIWTRG